MIPVSIVFLHHIHLLLLFFIFLVIFEIFDVSFLRLRFGYCWLIEMSRRLVRLLFLNWSIMLLGIFLGLSSFLLLFLLLTLFANLSCLLKNHLLELFLFTDHFKPLFLNNLLLKHLLLLDLLQDFKVFLLEILLWPIIAKIFFLTFVSVRSTNDIEHRLRLNCQVLLVNDLWRAHFVYFSLLTSWLS